MSGSPFGIGEYMASKEASEAQLEAANQAAAVQREMFYVGREDTAPWRAAGAGAINALWGTPGTPATTTQGAPIYGNALAGANVPRDASGNAVPEYIMMQGPEGWYTQLNPVYAQSAAMIAQQPQQSQITGYGPSTTTPATPGTQGLIQRGPGEFKASEGYQWTLGQGLQAQQRQASATGRMGSGAYLKDATRYAEGLASTEYDNFLRRYYASLEPYFKLAGYGGNLASGSAGLASSTGNALANTYLQGGEAQAAGILGKYSAVNNSMGQAGNQIGNWAMNNSLSSTGNAWGGWGNTLAGSGAGANMMMWL